MDVQCKMVKELLSIQKQSQLFVKETSCRLGINMSFTFALELCLFYRHVTIVVRFDFRFEAHD